MRRCVGHHPQIVQETERKTFSLTTTASRSAAAIPNVSAKIVDQALTIEQVSILTNSMHRIPQATFDFVRTQRADERIEGTRLHVDSTPTHIYAKKSRANHRIAKIIIQPMRELLCHASYTTEIEGKIYTPEQLLAIAAH